MNKLNQHILAAYYNDARLNILYCLNDIRIKSGIKPVTDDAEIKSAFSTLSLINVEPERQRDLIQHLRERFHFLDVLTDFKPPKDKKKTKTQENTATPLPQHYDSILNRLFTHINDLRNTMVHPTDGEMLLDLYNHKGLFFDLSKIYDSSLTTVKTRFELNAASITPLLLCDNKGKPKSAAKFPLALCTDPKDRQNTDAIKQSQILHDFGHVLLCSLFLDKSQSAELVSYFWQAYPATKWSTEQKAIIKELISVYRVRLPMQRLKSDNTVTSVTLDSLSELSRCPRPLLSALNPSDQKRFRVSSSPIANDDEDSSYLFARGHQNRFIPLMMRFLDFDANCKIRFAVDLGQFYYNVRLKPASQFTDQRSRVRRLGQKIVAYGCLLEFEQTTKPDVWQQLEDNYLTSNDDAKNTSRQASDSIEQLKPYIVPCYPHYHYYDDKIGFRLATEEQATYPELTEDALSNISLESKAGKEMAPEFWISPSQILHLGFYSYLQKTQTNYWRLDILLNRYRAGMEKLLKTLVNDSPHLSGEAFSLERREQAQHWIDSFFAPQQGKQFYISLSDLPLVLVHHLISSTVRQVSIQEIIDRAKHILHETERKQQQIEDLLKVPKKRGKKGFKPIKCGHIGDFLTDDLMRFQPINTHKSDGGKINSQQYQILQAALAYYGAHLEEPPKIVDLLKDAGLLSGDFAHPFLPKLIHIDKPKQYAGLISFYQAYLQARKRYLENFINTNEQHQTFIEPPKWLRIRQQSTLDNWLKEQYSQDGKLQPLPVPKAMLYPPLLAMVAHAIGTSPSALEQQGTQHFPRNNQAQEVNIRPSISWLLKCYLAHHNDNTQEMYRYVRHHRLFDTFLDTRSGKGLFKEKPLHYFSELKRQAELITIREHIASLSIKDEEEKTKLSNLLKLYKRDEQTIRHFATQDSLLYLYAKQYLNTLQFSHTAPPQWSLNTIEKTLLNTPIDYTLPVPQSDKHLRHSECKIRNLGEMSLLVRDRRLPSLLAYYLPTETAINQAEIRAELSSYRRAKVAAMALVHQLEQKTVNCFGVVPERVRKPKRKEQRILSAEQSESIARFGDGRHGDFLALLYAKQHAQTGATDKDAALSCVNQALLLRNAFSHNEYPKAEEFASIVEAVRLENIPENPAKHREIAGRLVKKMENLYEPWLTFLNVEQRKH